MAKSKNLTSSLAITASLLAFGAVAEAQAPQQAEAPSAPAPQNRDTVVVTGSLIRGTPEDAALPVDVITADTLLKQGAPSNVDIIKNLPTMGATFAGDANPLGASRVQGASSINLRGLGNARTLVLLNGRRLAPITSGTQTLTDTNSLPMMAIERIEVLEDGGAATYGSDAIAGVVNFITSKNFEGLDVSGTYSFIDGSDGDLNASVKWGFGSDTTNIVLGAGYQHRGQLKVTDRDWAYRPYLENPTGWSSSGNPGIYQVGNTATSAQSFTDPGCEALGNELSPLAGMGAARYCLEHYIGFENLVDEQEAFQTFFQLNSDISDTTRVYIDALYSQINVNEVATVGSSTVLNPPTTQSTGGPGPGIIATRFFIPASNPGLAGLLSDYTAAQLGITDAAYAIATNSGVNARLSWRPIGIGGNPAFGYGPKLDHRRFTFYRASGGFAGTDILGYNIDWDLNSTFSSAKADSTGEDIISSRFQYALRGLGGADCTPGGSDPATSTPGVGPCMYYNPFSNAVAQNALTGAANTGFNGTLNDPELTRWFFNRGGSISTNELWTVDGVLTGDIPAFALPGGNIGWAIGAQYRRSRTVVQAQNDLGNAAINPCVDEGQPLSSCPNDPRGVTGLFGPVVERDYDQEVTAQFAELSLPLLDNLNAQVAVRRESHDAGETTNPKIALRWEPIDGLAFRASAQSTYRAPDLSTLDPRLGQTITAAIGLVRVPYDVQGNPELEAETSNNYNAGVILDVGGFTATLDYWIFELQDQLILENVPALVNTMFPTGVNNCGNPAFAELQARFTFTSAGCSTIANIDRVSVTYQNGAPVDASGIDMSLLYMFDQPLLGGDVTLGLDATYNLEYNIGATQQFGVTLTQAFDAVGLLNVGIDPRALPQWRAQFSANYARGPHNVRWITNHVDSMRDQRAGSGGANDLLAQVAGFPVGTIVTGGADIESFTTHDLHYSWEFNADTTFNVSVVNLLDQDPPFTRNELSYDAFTATPLGRVFKVGFRKSF